MSIAKLKIFQIYLDLERDLEIDLLSKGDLLLLTGDLPLPTGDLLLLTGDLLLE